MNSATLVLIADLQTQIETLNSRIERLEVRDIDWVEQVAAAAAQIAVDHAGLPSLEDRRLTVT